MSIEKERLEALFKRSREAYGSDRECIVFMEEAGELVQAISKYLRYGAAPGVVEHLAEEIADVRLMSEKIINLLGLDEEVQRVFDFKVNRLESRLNDLTATGEIIKGERKWN